MVARSHRSHCRGDRLAQCTESELLVATRTKSYFGGVPFFDLQRNLFDKLTSVGGAEKLL